jgi:hypothetical protein
MKARSVWPLLVALTAQAAGCTAGDTDPPAIHGQSLDGLADDFDRDEIAAGGTEEDQAPEPTIQAVRRATPYRQWLTTSDGSKLLAYDPVTLDECEAHFEYLHRRARGQRGAGEWWHKNHYSACWFVEAEVDWPIRRDLPPVEPFLTGSAIRQVVVLQGGINTEEGAPVRKARLLVRTKPLRWPGSALYPPFTGALVTFAASCGPGCAVSNGGIMSGSLASWLERPRAYDFTVTSSATCTPGDLDCKSFHEVSLSMTADPTVFLPPIQLDGKVGPPTSPAVRMRCDTATYNWHFGINRRDNGACTFVEMDAVLHYARRQYPHVAPHIWIAQHDAFGTEPTHHEFDRGNTPLIPGDRLAAKPERWPLHRLVVTTSTDPVKNDVFKNGARRDRNRALARATCNRYWPRYAWATSYPANALGWPDPCGIPNLTQLTPSWWDWHTLDCDEYPFASTYEGAAAYEYFSQGKHRPGDPSGNEQYYSYSACPIPWWDNQAAGGALARWYAADHILEKDPFWVEVTQP